MRVEEHGWISEIVFFFSFSFLFFDCDVGVWGCQDLLEVCA